MMLDLIRFLRGTVDFEVKDGYPERFLSSCGRIGLPLFHIRRKGDSLTASTTLRGGKRLRETAAKSGVTLTIGKRHGIPSMARQYRMRTGVFAGLGLLVLVPLLLSMFLWRIEISGNETVSTPLLRQTLGELGVHRGAISRGIDTREVERQLIISCDQISWAAVNIRGSRASVEIRERALQPPPMDTVTPYNIIAKRGGYITRMDVYEGQAAVRNGDSVLEGDVLVSGIMENGRQENRTVHARAKVIAQVEESLAVTIPYRRTVYGYRGLQVHRSLDLFGKLIPLDRGGAPDGLWKLETATEPFPVLGGILPLQVIRQNYILLEEAMEEITPDEARLEAEAELRLLEKQQFEPDSIISREITGQELSDSFIIFADYVRLTDIAEEREIYRG